MNSPIQVGTDEGDALGLDEGDSPEDDGLDEGDSLGAALGEDEGASLGEDVGTKQFPLNSSLYESSQHSPSVANKVTHAAARPPQLGAYVGSSQS